MPRLQVHQLPAEDVYKDIIRVSQAYRIDNKGNVIKEGQICSVRANGRSCFAILRGYQLNKAPEIRMDDFTREHRLGLGSFGTYDFVFMPASALGQFWWAWNATEVAYRLSSRLALLGFAAGLLGFFAGILPGLLFGGTGAQSEPLNRTVPILSLTVAAIAVFFGPLVTLRISRREVELSRRVASKQIVAPMRQAWINDLRDKLGELCSSALHYWNAGFEERTDDEYKRLEWLEAQIVLRINPEEKDHQELTSSIRRMISSLESGAFREPHKFIEAHQQTTGLGQRIFKAEWNRIKDDISARSSFTTEVGVISERDA